jgi:hypothetical protein
VTDDSRSRAIDLRTTPARVLSGCNRVLLPERVEEWGSGGIHGFWRDELGSAAGVELDVPFLAVHDDVMVLAQETHIA